MNLSEPLIAAPTRLGRPRRPIPVYTEAELYLLAQQHGGQVCYLIHFSQPIFKQYNKLTGEPIYVRHYLGTTSDLVARIQDHKTTRWIPFADGQRQPGTKPGSSKRGERHGKGAVIVAYANHLGVPWELVRVWDNAGRQAEKQLKSGRHNARYCPVCWNLPEDGGV